MTTLSKQSGLGDALYVGGYDLSGDTQSLGAIGGGPATIDVTGINKSAYERIGGIRDGRIEWTSYFNPDTDKAHPVLSALPTNDVHVLYCRGAALGSPAAAMVSKQINYDGNRGDDGAVTFSLQAQANGYGLEWGSLLTAGTRTDTAATNGTGIDTTESLSFGGQAYLQVTEFTGTDVTVKIQDSADNSSFSDVTGLSFTEITAGPTSERISISNTSTIRRYVRAVTTTSAGFTSLSFAVSVVKNTTEGVTF